MAAAPAEERRKLRRLIAHFPAKSLIITRGLLFVALVRFRGSGAISWFWCDQPAGRAQPIISRRRAARRRARSGEVII
jgi:hypothetical protein